MRVVDQRRQYSGALGPRVAVGLYSQRQPPGERVRGRVRVRVRVRIRSRVTRAGLGLG